jgi:hypothetical protein
VQRLTSAGSKGFRNYLGCRIGAFWQQHFRQIGGSAHIGRALTERFPECRFGTRKIATKAQRIAKIIANFGRITPQRDGALKQRRGRAEIPPLQPRHGLIQQGSGAWFNDFAAHGAGAVCLN